MSPKWGYAAVVSVDNPSTNARRRTPEAAAFAAQLRAERAARDMTQEQLADLTGIGRQTILRIEKGIRVMDTAQLGDICRALGITLTEFAIRAEQRMQDEAAAASKPRRTRRAQ